MSIFLGPSVVGIVVGQERNRDIALAGVLDVHLGLDASRDGTHFQVE